MGRARSLEDVLKALLPSLSPLLEGCPGAVWEVGCGSVLAVLTEEALPQGAPPAWVVRAAEEGKPQVAVGSPARAWPLLAHGEVVAVLELRPREPLPQGVTALVSDLLEALTSPLETLLDLAGYRLLQNLLQRLGGASSLVECGQRSLEVLLEVFDPDAGSLWEICGSTLALLVPVSFRRPVDEEVLRAFPPRLPYGVGLAWRVYETGEALFTSRYADEPQAVPFLRALGWQSVAVLPLVSPRVPKVRRVMVLGSQEKRFWRAYERKHLFQAAQVLGAYIEPLLQKGRYEAINRLFMELLRRTPEELYFPLLEEAIRHVPGAEAGSLLVLQEGVYRFVVAVGFDFQGLQTIRFSQEAMRLWYARELEDLLQGEPRILSEVERPVAEISHRTAPVEVIDTAGKAWEIRANLCLPIPYEGEVLAYINLDNFHDPGAFGEDSLEAARFFTAPLATLLHESRLRRLLEEAALTDSLTGLLNRRAFDQIFHEELSRAERYGHALALALLDLKGFKRFNDLLGHAAGDLALKRVAEALEREKREGDKLFRWGGDEFVALFPHTSRDQALAVAFRYVQAISAICLEGLCLGVTIGVAAYPEDGKTPELLLQAADTRLYQAKARGLPVMA